MLACVLNVPTIFFFNSASYYYFYLVTGSLIDLIIFFITIQFFLIRYPTLL